MNFKEAFNKFIEIIVVIALISAVIILGVAAFAVLVTGPFALVGFVLFSFVNLFGGEIVLTYWTSFVGGFGIIFIIAMIKFLKDG